VVLASATSKPSSAGAAPRGTNAIVGCGPSRVVQAPYAALRLRWTNDAEPAANAPQHMYSLYADAPFVCCKRTGSCRRCGVSRRTARGIVENLSRRPAQAQVDLRRSLGQARASRGRATGSHPPTQRADCRLTRRRR
jgi:hypothetical protein